MAHRISGSELAIGLTSLDSTEAKKFSVAVATGNVDTEGTLDVAGRTQLAASGVGTTVRGTFGVDEAATFTGAVALNDDATLATGKQFVLDNYDASAQVGFKKLAVALDYQDPASGAQPSSGADDILISEAYLFEALAGNDALFQLADYTATNQGAERALRINGNNDGFDVSPAVEFPDSGIRVLEGKLIFEQHPMAAGESLGQYQLAYVDMDSTSGALSLKKAYGKAISGSFSAMDMQWLRGACLINVAATTSSSDPVEVVMPGQIIKEQAVAGFVMPTGIASSMSSASNLAEAKASAAYFMLG
jgi:hypothetical protein